MDTKIFNKFKPIINQLRKYYYKDVINFVIKTLDQQWGLDILKIHNMKYPLPWHLFTLLNWSCAYSEKIDKTKKRMSNKDFLKIYRLLNENLVENISLLQSDKNLGIYKFMRAEFYAQQYYYQYVNNLYFYVVQRIIYEDIGINYDLNKFYSFSEVDITHFMDLQFVLFSFSLKNKNTVFSANNLIGHWPNSYDELSKFLNNISNDIEGLSLYCMKYHKMIDNPEFEKSLFTPLYRFPLIKQETKFRILYPALLNHFVNFAVFDLLKEKDSNNFANSFGIGFEKYLEYSLKKFKHYIGSSVIQKYTGIRNRSSCDFAIFENNNVVLVEAKSSELHPLNLVNPDKKYLERYLRDSILHGYKQIIQTAESMNDELENVNKFYGVIVTFKPLFLGNPKVIWDEIVCDYFKKNEYSFDKKVINENNIFVMSIQDFEKLCVLCEKENKELITKLDEINSKTGFYTMDLEVPDLIDYLPHIKDKLNFIENSLKGSIKQHQNVP
jgi:hypothetical protein